jgi:hypothetical protein
VIPEYKLYHGAVLSELVDRAGGAVSIEAYGGSAGRLLNYVVSGAVGMQVRHATQRLRPWPFTFSKDHLDALASLRRRCKSVFLVLVCNTDGMVCLPGEEARKSLSAAVGAQAWLRVDREKGKWYRLYGPAGEFPSRFPSGIDPLVVAVRQLTGT